MALMMERRSQTSSLFLTPVEHLPKEFNWLYFKNLKRMLKA